MLNLKLTSKKQNLRRVKRKENPIALDVRKVLKAADQKLIVMVRS